MTLSERFAMYQRKAAEAEIRKPRKSPEIHRYSPMSHYWSERIWSALCTITLLFVLPSGESMFPPVPLRGTLTSLMIWRRPATRWPALLEFHIFATRKLWDVPKQQCSALCFSFKGCVFLSQNSPIVYCKCQASFPSLCDMVIGYCTNPSKG